MRFARFWQGEDGLRNIIPNRAGNEFPEGIDVIRSIQELIDYKKEIVDVGCGRGRLATAFSPLFYTGVDCNVAAITKAQELVPGYTFRVVTDYEYPESEVKLAYTVAIHIPDDEYPNFVRALCDSTVEQIVIGEILGRDKRRQLEHKKDGWIQPTFGRDIEDHSEEFGKNGWSLTKTRTFKYPTKGQFSFLIFSPQQKRAA